LLGVHGPGQEHSPSLYIQLEPFRDGHFPLVEENPTSQALKSSTSHHPLLQVHIGSGLQGGQRTASSLGQEPSAQMGGRRLGQDGRQIDPLEKQVGGEFRQ
jgi:hypothetical protein